jgi:GNAT superfamily N-acetyltransferase
MSESKFVWAKSDDPKCVEWESKGYEFLGESWGAHLTLTPNSDLSNYSSRITKSKNMGFELMQLSEAEVEQVLALEESTNADYPYTPATSHPVPTKEELVSVISNEGIIFGAFFEGKLIGVLSTKKMREKVEFDFASIDSPFRGKGLASALGSLAIQTYSEDGIYVFATGGASVNASSKGTVESLGFEIDEFWRSYKEPSRS